MSAPLIRDPEYVQGQIDALHAMLLAVASKLLDPGEFRDVAMPALESQRNSLLNKSVSESRLQAIDRAIDWVKTLE